MSVPDYLISTPENVDLHLELAGAGNRILACLIDTLLTYSMMIGVTIACWIIDYLIGTAPILPSARVVIAIVITVVGFIVSFLIYFGYFIYFETAWQGLTPGKKVAGIRVVEQNGQPVSRSSVFIRNLLRVIDEGILLVGLLVMVIDPKERRLGDLAANTIVIRERKTSFSTSDLKITAQLSDSDAFDAGRISAEEYELLLNFLKRRQQLDRGHRLIVANKLEEYFAQKLGVPVNQANAELFLESIFLSYQARAES